MVKHISDKDETDSPILSLPTPEPRTCSSTVERFVYIEDVGGSNPSKSTKLRQSPVRRGVALHRKCRGFEPLSVHAQYLLSFSA